MRHRVRQLSYRVARPGRGQGKVALPAGRSIPTLFSPVVLAAASAPPSELSGA